MWILVEIASYIIYGIFVAIAIYGNVVLYPLRREMFVAKRSKLVLYALNIAFILAIIVCLLCQVSMTKFALGSNVQLFTFSSYLIIWWFLLCCLITKNWMIYYKYNWTYYIMESEWTKLINSNESSHKVEQNWFLINNNKWGNLHFVTKIFGSVCFFEMIISTIPAILLVIFDFHLYVMLIVAFVMAVSFGPIIIFYAYIVRKTPLIDDEFAIHWESKMHAKLLICLAGWQTLLNLTFILMITEHFDVEHFHIVTIAMPGIGLILFLMNYVSTFSIIKKNTSSIQNDHGLAPIKSNSPRSPSLPPPQLNILNKTVSSSEHDRDHDHTLQDRDSHSTHSMKAFPQITIMKLKSSARSSSRSSSTVSLKDVLSNELAINLFMQHLSSEFSP